MSESGFFVSDIYSEIRKFYNVYILSNDSCCKTNS